MKSWQFVVMGATCLALAACRTDPNISILERELRFQEDKIYHLQDCLDDEQATLEACRRENDALRKRLNASEGAADSRSEPTPGRGLKGFGAPAGPVLEPPAVELPSESVPESQLPRTLRAPAEAAPLEKQPSAEKPHPAPRPNGSAGQAGGGPILPGLAATDGDAENRSAEGDRPARRGDSRQVAQIVLNRLVSGRCSSGGRNGRDGVLLVIEPRDAEGRLIEAPANVSVAVLDPAEQSEATRVARWDFTAAELASRFRATAGLRGYELEMPWPADPPPQKDLHLFVRYTTSDGRKLDADQVFKVSPPGQLIRDWAPTERDGDAESARSASRATRVGPAWRPNLTPTISARGKDSLAPDNAERSDEAPLRTAALPASSVARRLPATREPKVERPVWSPERE
jgi:uncharacterized coiled-coil protein SlyX